MVRVWWRGILLVAIALCFFPLAVRAEESVSRLQVEATLSSSRWLEVREEITYDFGETPRGGIQRILPIIARDGARIFRLPLQDVSATRDGQPLSVQSEQTKQHVVLTLSGPNESLQGIHTYVLRYQVRLTVTDWADHQSWSWPITGDGWTVPSQAVSFLLHTPNSLQSLSCMSGAGASAQPCVVKMNGTVATVTASQPVAPHDPFWVQATLPPGTLPPLSWWLRLMNGLADYPYILIPFLTFVLMFVVWWIRGRDPIERRGVRPTNHVPRGLPPGLLGLVYTQEALPDIFTATCLDLARRGFLTITCVGDFDHETAVWSLTRTSLSLSKLLPFERVWLEGLLNPGQTVHLTKQERGTHHDTIEATRAALVKELVKRQWFVRDPLQTRGRWLFLAFLIACFSGISILWRDAAFFWAGMCSAIIIAAFGWFMPRTTPEGATLTQEIESFRQFLQTGASDHHELRSTAEQFTQLLPEVIALNSQVAFAQQFEGILIPPPHYLETEMTMWSATELVHALAHFQHDLIRFFFLHPHESMEAYHPE